MRQFTLNHHTHWLGISLLVLSAWFLSGCGDGYSSPSTASTPTSIAITPSSAMIISGETANLTAIGSYTNGSTADITGAVNWISAASTTASVTGVGVVTGNAIGTTSVTASINGGVYGVTSDAAGITVTGANLTGLSISPLTLSFARGSTAVLTATGTFSDATNGNISGSVTWTSSDPAVVTVNASGIATGVSAGTSTITATKGAISNVATLTVL